MISKSLCVMKLTIFFSVASLFLGVTNQFLDKTYVDSTEIYPDDEIGLPMLRMERNLQQGIVEFEYTRAEGKTESLAVSIDDYENYAKALVCVVKAIVNR